jgi:hypothetical protein
MKNLLIVSVLVLLLLSCKKDIYDANSNFKGNWIGKDGKYSYEFIIEDNSKGHFKVYLDNEIDKEHNGILRLENEKLIMSGLYKFTVITEPQQLDSSITFILHDYEYPVTWKMKLKTPNYWGGSEVVYYK